MLLLAEVKGRVNIGLTHAQQAWLGQQVNINLDLETSGFSFSDIQFNLPEVGGAILMQPDTTTIKLTESRLGEQWQILRYPLVLYPQKSGVVTVPPVSVRFQSSAAFGEEPRNFDLRTGSLTLRVMQPPGTLPGERIVSTTAYEMHYEWQPEGTAFTVGDALQLRVTQRAAGVSGMFLEPVPGHEDAGFSLYVEPPEIEDRVNRGVLTGWRTDRLTWVFEQPGQYGFPAHGFQWWDPQAQQLKQSRMPAWSLEVAANPLVAASDGAAFANVPGAVRPVLLLFALLAALGLAWRFLPRVPWRSGPSDVNTEQERFKQLLRACRDHDARRTYALLSRWLASLQLSEPALSASQFALQLGNRDLLRQVQGLQTALIQDDPGWSGTELRRLLVQVREGRRLPVRSDRAYHLLPINPPGFLKNHA
jgi:hypothetical protein